ncbi:hypothetical protein ACIRTB_31815 [Streptomyces sp. NPDC101158]
MRQFDMAQISLRAHGLRPRQARRPRTTRATKAAAAEARRGVPM